MAERCSAQPRVNQDPEQYIKGCCMVPCNVDAKPCGPTKLCHARNYYNPAKNCVYSRFSDCDWDKNNIVNNCYSNQERNLSQKLRTDAWQTVTATEKLTRFRQASNSNKLSDRSNDIAFWKEEIIREMNSMDTEIEYLSEHKRILQKALYDSNVALSIAEECVIQREKRVGIEQTHDEPERALCKEVVLIRQCQARMKKTIERTNAQLRLNRCARHACDIDTRDKHHAELLDDRMKQLQNCSFGIGYHPGIESVDNTISDVVSWVKYNQETIQRSRKQRENSQRVRSDIDLCLRQCANDMYSQFSYVNEMLKKRVGETDHAKRVAERNLLKINTEIRDLERALELLRCALADKEFPMKVAQTRLDERTRRICVEICHDAPMTGLQTEVYELRQTIATLKEKIRSAEMTLCRLQKVRSRLETEINAKEKSIQIDKRCCLGMRKYIAVEPKVGPFFLLNNSATAGSTSHMLRCGPHEDVMVGNTQRGCCPLFAGTVCCL